MANVLFKQGLQEKLDLIRREHKATEGTFYLTTDSHRLYIGRITGEGQTATACDAVPVNEGVSSVTSIGELPKVGASNWELYSGQFYYVTDSNILCVYSGQKGWVQLNPNTDTKIEDVDIAITVENNVATVRTKVLYTDENGQAAGLFKDDSYQIAGAGGTKVDVAEATINVNGKSEKVDKLTITGEEYTLDTEHSTAAKGSLKVKLKSSFTTDDNNRDSVITVLKAGQNIDSIVADGTINAHNTSLNGGSLKIATGNGGVDGDGKNTTESTTGFNFKITDSDNFILKASVDPKIVLGDNTDTSYKFETGTATLPIYTKEEIDRKLADLDAMTFRGLIGDGAPITTPIGLVAHAGDAYKTTSAFLVTTGYDSNGAPTRTTVDVGDMIIAVGDEYRLEDVTKNAAQDGKTYTRADGSTGTYTLDGAKVGTIIPSKLSWAVIPSGDDDDLVLKYKGVAIDKGLKLVQNEAAIVAELTADGAPDGYITVTDEKDAKNPYKNKILIKHNSTDRTDTTAKEASQNGVSSMSFTAVTGVSSNPTGHVIGVETQKVTVVDTNGYLGKNLYNATLSSETDGSQVVSLTNTSVSNYSNTAESARSIGGYKIKSSSLSISVPTAADVGVNTTRTNVGGVNVPTYTQKTDPVIVLDMVWGSFD